MKLERQTSPRQNNENTEYEIEKKLTFERQSQGQTCDAGKENL